MAQQYQPRLADIVADRLRKDILSGRYAEGDFLPSQANLFEDFQVSAPAVREAIRVLENEGLIQTRRGSAGGAVVHLPTHGRIAQVIGMVLQSRGVDPTDVGRALVHIEPICAAMCAERADRATEVIPALREKVEIQLDQIDDPTLFMPNARGFHEAMVENCGNETIIVAIGALEAIWSAHASPLWNDDIIMEPLSPNQLRDAVTAHVEIIDAIERGDATLAANLAREHAAFTSSMTPRLSHFDVVDASLISRDQSTRARQPAHRSL
jgi:GntR family transcriptional repressor for pyruvate dehydrogenase complex